ncbi:MAG: ribose 5-phosphate isomerase B [Eubacterium sp.]|nr:ribose 5-phosphate isomerase B [Eubacterium sp.]
MRIAIGNDHAATDLKMELIPFLESMGHEVTNYGTDGKESCDYPIYAHRVCEAVLSGQADRGILICGTGVGISLAANKHKGIRCALCSEPVTAKLTREHNNSNVIAFGARVIGIEVAKAIVTAYLNAEFTPNERHVRRLKMVEDIENGLEI